MARASVCLSVSPSVTLYDCIKTVQAKITKASPWANKILCPWDLGAGVPFERRRQRGVGLPLKDVILQLLARIV